MADKRFVAGATWSMTSAILWGTMYIVGRYLLRDPRIDPLSLATIRFLIAGGAFAGWSMLTARQKFLGISRRDVLHFIGLGLAGVFAQSLLLFMGLQWTTAINSSLISQIAPVFVVVLGVHIGERLRPLQVLGVLFGLSGCAFVVGAFKDGRLAFETGHATGDLCIAGAALCWAIYSVAGKPIVRRHGGLVCTTWAMIFGSLELLIVWLIVPHTPLAGHLGFNVVIPHDLATWLVVVYVAIFPAGLAFFAWYEAMSLIPLALLNITQYFTPAFVVILAYLFLGERLTSTQAAGMGLIVIGTILSGIAPRPAKQQ